jgi:methyltransferase FkbM-like protein
VQTTTLDAFVCEHEPPDLVLLDIEGYAGEALNGARTVLARHPKIICEIHHAAEEAVVSRLLREHGYILRAIDRRRSYPFHVLARQP